MKMTYLEYKREHQNLMKELAYLISLGVDLTTGRNILGVTNRLADLEENYPGFTIRYDKESIEGW